ncbi:hypothetical protein WHR41_01396 [Cladosporium halotolerans]|uniref:Fe2OG dioxygenase domain-containing protein n=1 Tax=Cladosporium halotolerans TaxID=1052096 RepID=A0AB34L2P3_9PEZI
MAQTSEKHHHASQLGASAIAPPAGLDALPPPAPALHHLRDDHTFDSQLGSAAIAPPNGEASLPPQLPAQYHLTTEPTSSTQQQPIKRFQTPPSTAPDPIPKPSSQPIPDNHTTTSQLGPSAIAAPPQTASLPSPLPAQSHAASDPQSHETQLGPNAIAPPAIPRPEPSEAHDETETEDLTFPTLPPFPSTTPTAPLTRLSLRKLLARDADEEQRLWTASRDLGFFYLDLRDAGSSSSEIDGPALEASIDALFALGEEVFALPVEEKQKYDFKDQGSYFGYKGLGAGVVDAKGTRDGNEFYNVSKDDVLGVSDKLPAPGVLRAEEARGLLAGFVRRGHAVVSLLLRVLEERLGVDLRGLHRLEKESGDQVRWVRAPAREEGEDEGEEKRALGEHTDFGSLTLLANRLGGLQILPPDSKTWTYVRPLRHHLIVNLGDALVKFSGGQLRSNLHRVVRAPGEQSRLPRMSLVYFSRPEDDVVLRDLTKGEHGASAEGGVTAKEWILRRALGRRVGGDYGVSEGTEGGRV